MEDRATGKRPATTDQHDRHDESFASEETRYDTLAAEEERVREAALARLAAHPLPDPNDD